MPTEVQGESSSLNSSLGDGTSVQLSTDGHCAVATDCLSGKQ
jgi:hypothetical protein